MQAVSDFNYMFRRLDSCIPEPNRANIALVLWQVLQQSSASAFQEMQEILYDSTVPEVAEGESNGE